MIKLIFKFFAYEYLCFKLYIFRPIFVVISLFVIALCVPTFLVHDIVKVADTEEGALYTVGLSELSTGNTCFIFKANLWLTGIVFKVGVLQISMKLKITQFIIFRLFHVYYFSCLPSRFSANLI